MPPPRTGDLSASLAILGLLVERPDTVASVRIRLEQRFPDAHWGRTAVGNNLSSLVNQGHIRLVKKGHTKALNSYEATAGGVAHFRKWIRESVAVPLVLRDGMQGKLSFSTQDDLLGLIETIRQEEAAYKRRYAVAHLRSLEIMQLRHRSAGGADYEAMIIGVMALDEAKLWGLHVKRLQELLDALEKLSEGLPALRAVREVADG